MRNMTMEINYDFEEKVSEQEELIAKLKAEVSSRDDSIEYQKKVIQDKEEELYNLKDEKGLCINYLLLDYNQKELEKVTLENKKLKDEVSELNDAITYQKKLDEINQQELDDLNYECSKLKSDRELTQRQKRQRVYGKFDRSTELIFKNIGKLCLQETIKNHTDRILALSYFEKDGFVYLVSGSMDKHINIWDESDSKSVKVSTTLSRSACVTSMTLFQKNDQQFIAISLTSDIEVWNLEFHALEYTLKGHINDVYALSNYKSNGKQFIISGGDDTTIKLWDTDSKTCFQTFKGHSDTIYSLDIYQKDGKHFLVSGSSDKTVKLWNLDCKFLVTTLTGHSNWIESVKVFLKKGNPYLASGSYDNTIKIWNLTNFQLEATLTGHRNIIVSLELIPTNNKVFLASGSYDNTIKLWDLENFTLLKTLSVRSRPRSFTTLNINNIPHLVSGHANGTIMIWSE